MTKTTVLLSGGIDSCAALLWAIEQDRDPVEALTFLYGQPHRREVEVAKLFAQEAGVPWSCVNLTDAFAATGLLASVSDHNTAPGTHSAFVEGRNALFLTVAAARGAGRIVIGCCLEDQAGFPDCRPTPLGQMSAALTSMLGRVVIVDAPFVSTPKATLIEKIGSARSELAWSCYRGGTVPCGACSPCVLRTS